MGGPWSHAANGGRAMAAKGRRNERDRLPADEARARIGYQKLAWYASPFGDMGVALLVLAAVVDGLRRVARASIRMLVR